LRHRTGRGLREVLLTEFDEASVRTFLKQFKSAARRRHGGLGVFEANDVLADLGVTRKSCVDEILSLSVEDYSSGPDPDHGAPGEIWVFGVSINGVEVYIKLKLAEYEGHPIPKCLSFHRANEPLYYPFRNSAVQTE
jgi:hypothetical protein